MSDKKISFRDEIKLNTQKSKEEQASKDFKRNSIGLYFSAIVFFGLLSVQLYFVSETDFLV